MCVPKNYGSRCARYRTGGYGAEQLSPVYMLIIWRTSDASGSRVSLVASPQRYLCALAWYARAQDACSQTGRYSVQYAASTIPQPGDSRT
jgi:hypothetical protein